MERPPVVILSGVRWDFLWQRHQDLATLFSRAGYPTVFVETTGLANPHPNRETLRKVASRLSRAGGEGSSAEEGLTVYSPLTERRQASTEGPSPLRARGEGCLRVP